MRRRTTCTHTRTHILKHTHTHSHAQAQKHAQTHTQAHTRTDTHAQAHTRVHTHRHFLATCTHTHKYTHVHTHTHTTPQGSKSPFKRGRLLNVIRGGQRSNCSGDAIFLMQIVFDGPQSLGSIGPPQWSGQKSSSDFGTEFPHYRPLGPIRTSFHPKTRQEYFLYHKAPAWLLKSKFGEGCIFTFLAPLFLIFSKENGPKWSI